MPGTEHKFALKQDARVKDDECDLYEMDQCDLEADSCCGGLTCLMTSWVLVVSWFKGLFLTLVDAPCNLAVTGEQLI
jgi:hypothetical protein